MTLVEISTILRRDTRRICCTVQLGQTIKVFVDIQDCQRRFYLMILLVKVAETLRQSWADFDDCGLACIPYSAGWYKADFDANLQFLIIGASELN